MGLSFTPAARLWQHHKPVSLHSTPFAGLCSRKILATWGSPESSSMRGRLAGWASHTAQPLESSYLLELRMLHMQLRLV